MSLAWAILKENHDNIKAKTLFATHYHELVLESQILK
jgi:DNA mismatch repair protein MutS